MKIGELSKQTGISVSAIRYYESEGLLPKPERRESGYRDYEEADAQRVRLIAAAKNQRFPLKVIQLCLEAIEGAEEPCREVAGIVRQRLKALDTEIEELQTLRSSLQKRLHAFEKGSLEKGECLCAILEETPTHIKEKNKMATIEIFTGNCSKCDEAVRNIKEAVSACGCQVKVLSIDSQEAKDRGINLVPCIWKDGEQVMCGAPTLEEAIAKFRMS